MTDERARRDIQALLDALVAAWNAHDAHAYAAPFAPDAEFTNVFGLVQNGRAAIEAAHGAIFKTMFRESRLALTKVRIRFLRPDVAAVAARWTMTGAYGAQGKPWPARCGLISQIATREQGVWSIAVSHNMDLPSEDVVEAAMAQSEG